jgi:hypothetical protein
MLAIGRSAFTLCLAMRLPNFEGETSSSESRGEVGSGVLFVQKTLKKKAEFFPFP